MFGLLCNKWFIFESIAFNLVAESINTWHVHQVVGQGEMGSLAVVAWQRRNSGEAVQQTAATSPRRPARLNPSPNCPPCPRPQSRGQMASPEGQVLFSLVIPRPPPSSAKHLSDRNLPVMLAQSFMSGLSEVSIHHIIRSLEEGGGWEAYQRVKGVLIIWRGGGLSTRAGPLVGTWWERKWYRDGQS